MVAIIQDNLWLFDVKGLDFWSGKDCLRCAGTSRCCILKKRKTPFDGNHYCSIRKRQKSEELAHYTVWRLSEICVLCLARKLLMGLSGV